MSFTILSLYSRSENLKYLSDTRMCEFLVLEAIKCEVDLPLLGFEPVSVGRPARVMYYMSLVYLIGPKYPPEHLISKTLILH